MKIVRGDILSPPPPNHVAIIIHGCNSLGVMGAGLAHQIKQKFPSAFTDYLEHLRAVPKSLCLGTWVCSNQLRKNMVIVNAITQNGIGKHGVFVDYAAVAKIFSDIPLILDRISNFSDFSITDTDVSIRIPKIGCGWGGGDWDTTKDVIQSHCPDIIFDEYLELWERDS